MSKQEYTIFTRIGFLDATNCGSVPLQDGIEYAVSVGCTPVAWAPESTEFYSGTKDSKALREESLRAGRLIEKTPSGWVALGAEKQENRLLTQEECLRNIQQIIDSVLREVEPTSADLNAAMVLRDGTKEAAEATAWREQQKLKAELAAAEDAKRNAPKLNPFPAFRSPDCDSGPSDHLNASRHQMAGMKG